MDSRRLPALAAVLTPQANANATVLAGAPWGRTRGAMLLKYFRPTHIQFSKSTFAVVVSSCSCYTLLEHCAPLLRAAQFKSLHACPGPACPGSLALILFSHTLCGPACPGSVAFALFLFSQGCKPGKLLIQNCCDSVTHLSNTSCWHTAWLQQLSYAIHTK